MVKVIVVEFKRTDCFHFFVAGGVDAEGYNLLLVLGAPTLFAIAHKIITYIKKRQVSAI